MIVIVVVVIIIMIIVIIMMIWIIIMKQDDSLSLLSSWYSWISVPHNQHHHHLSSWIIINYQEVSLNYHESWSDDQDSTNLFARCFSQSSWRHLTFHIRYSKSMIPEMTWFLKWHGFAGCWLLLHSFFQKHDIPFWWRFPEKRTKISPPKVFLWSWWSTGF